MKTKAGFDKSPVASAYTFVPSADRKILDEMVDIMKALAANKRRMSSFYRAEELGGDTSSKLLVVRLTLKLVSSEFDLKQPETYQGSNRVIMRYVVCRPSRRLAHADLAHKLHQWGLWETGYIGLRSAHFHIIVYEHLYPYTRYHSRFGHTSVCHLIMRLFWS